MMRTDHSNGSECYESHTVLRDVDFFPFLLGRAEIAASLPLIHFVNRD